MQNFKSLSYTVVETQTPKDRLINGFPLKNKLGLMSFQAKSESIVPVSLTPNTSDVIEDTGRYLENEHIDPYFAFYHSLSRFKKFKVEVTYFYFLNRCRIHRST